MRSAGWFMPGPDGRVTVPTAEEMEPFESLSNRLKESIEREREESRKKVADWREAQLTMKHNRQERKETSIALEATQHYKPAIQRGRPRVRRAILSGLPGRDDKGSTTPPSFIVSDLSVPKILLHSVDVPKAQVVKADPKFLVGHQFSLKF